MPLPQLQVHADYQPFPAEYARGYVATGWSPLNRLRFRVFDMPIVSTQTASVRPGLHPSTRRLIRC